MCRPIGSCSHNLPLKWYNSFKGDIVVKDKDSYGGHICTALMVCPKCFKAYEKKDLILKTEKEEKEWMNETT